MVWDVLHRLYGWEHANLPGHGSAEAREVLLWLLSQPRGRDRLLKDLYRSSSFSEPTMRACLKHFVADGYIEIEMHGDDFRGKSVRPTAKLSQTLAAYQEQFLSIAAVVAAESRQPQRGLG